MTGDVPYGFTSASIALEGEIDKMRRKAVAVLLAGVLLLALAGPALAAPPTHITIQLNQIVDDPSLSEPVLITGVLYGLDFQDRHLSKSRFRYRVAEFGVPTLNTFSCAHHPKISFVLTFACQSLLTSSTPRQSRRGGMLASIVLTLPGIGTGLWLPPSI